MYKLIFYPNDLINLKPLIDKHIEFGYKEHEKFFIFESFRYEVFSRSKFLKDMIDNNKYSDVNIIINDYTLFNNSISNFNNLYIMNNYFKIKNISLLTEKQLRVGHNIPNMLIAYSFGSIDDWNKWN